MNRNLKGLSRQELLEGAKRLVAQELEIALQLLEYLHEIEAQLIYAELGFDSMWSFCTNYLGLSEGDAQRKLATMRLCKAVPEVKEDMTLGKISMTNAAQVQSFFNAERKAGKNLSVEEKKEILQSVHHLSKLECEKKLIQLSPVSAIPAERLRPVTEGHTELKVVLDSETLGVLNQLKDLLAHTLGDASYQTLIQYMAEETLKRVKKAKGLESEKVELQAEVAPPPVAVECQGDRHPISAKTRRIVFRRANGRCEYQSPDGKKCGSQHRLEINHKIPVAWGGSNELSHLELTCRTHNRLHAQQNLGQEWVQRFNRKG